MIGGASPLTLSGSPQPARSGDLPVSATDPQFSSIDARVARFQIRVLPDDVDEPAASSSVIGSSLVISATPRSIAVATIRWSHGSPKRASGGSPNRSAIETVPRSRRVRGHRPHLLRFVSGEAATSDEVVQFDERGD